MILTPNTSARQARGMTRRSLFALFAGGAAAIAADPERALWVPGKKKIFVPARSVGTSFNYRFTAPPLTNKDFIEAFEHLRRIRDGQLLWRGLIYTSVEHPSASNRISRPTQSIA